MFSRKLSIAALCCLSFFLGRTAFAQAKPDASGSHQPAAKASLDGVWLGELHADSQVLHLRLTIKTDAGEAHYTLYSLDQGATPVPCANVKLDGRSLSFEVPPVNGRWIGKVSADKKTLSGTWTQGGQVAPLPLDFARQPNAPPQ